MNWSKIVSIVVSVLATAGLVLVSLRAVSGGEDGQLRLTRRALDAAASQLREALEQPAEGLIAVAYSLSRGIDADLKSLSGARAAVRSGNEPTPFQSSKIQSAEIRVAATLTALQRKLSADVQVDGVALVDEAGKVLFSSSAWLVKGKSIDELTGSELSQQDFDQPGTRSGGPASLFGQVAAGSIRYGAITGAERLQYFAMVPVFSRGRFVGAVATERGLSTLPVVGEGVSAVFLSGAGELVLGDHSAEIPVNESSAPFVAIPRDPSASIGSYTLGFAGIFMADGQTGTWAMRFQVPTLAPSFGFVLFDNSNILARLRGTQLIILLLGLVTLVVQILALGGGRSLQPSLTALADFLGQLQQGRAEGHRINEARVPKELHRLVRAINKLIDQAGTGKISALASAPSVADVLDAQSIAGEAIGEDVMPPTDGPPDFSGLGSGDSAGPDPLAGLESGFPEFAGQEEDFNYQVPSDPAALPDGDEGDGYEAMVEYVAEEPEGAEGQDLRADLDLSEDAFAAIDSLTTETEMPPPEALAPMPPAPPQDAYGAAAEAPTAEDPLAAIERMASTEFSSSAQDPAATAVMRVSPDLLEQLRAAADQPSAAAAGQPTSAEPPSEGNDFVALERTQEPDLAASAPFTSSAPQLLADDETAATAVMKITPEFLDQLRERGDSAFDAAQAPVQADELAEVQDADIESLDPIADPQANHFRQVYDDFLDTRRQCGESAKLSFEKFAGRLEKSRAAVMQKTGCTDVRFQVYVKSGKAALKATPASA